MSSSRNERDGTSYFRINIDSRNAELHIKQHMITTHKEKINMYVRHSIKQA